MQPSSVHIHPIMIKIQCFVVGCNNEHSSRHLLPTSELNASMFTHLQKKEV